MTSQQKIASTIFSFILTARHLIFLNHSFTNLYRFFSKNQNCKNIVFFCYIQRKWQKKTGGGTFGSGFVGKINKMNNGK